MVDNREIINNINIRLETIAIINSFTNDEKNYYVVLLDKEDNDITATLRKHFKVKTWTFDLKQVETTWKELLKCELIDYFGQYMRAKLAFIEKFEVRKSENLDAIHNCEFLLDTFLSDIDKIVGGSYKFYRVKVNWSEGFYECYENDYLFDIGNKILFLHFGGSD